MTTIITAQKLLKKLNKLISNKPVGSITFNFAGIKVKIDTTDTVGITLQAWVKQYLLNNDIYFFEPSNTQEFPDFYLNNNNPNDHMLEVKAFNYDATPAFDIANFDSYCASVKEKPYRLDADYLVFGYAMSESGDITINKIWLYKIWQIAGTSKRYPLKTQVKREVIYNIRPNSKFKNGKKGPFNSKEDFLNALYETLKAYKGKSFAANWKNEFLTNYEIYYNSSIHF